MTLEALGSEMLREASAAICISCFKTQIRGLIEAPCGQFGQGHCGVSAGGVVLDFIK